MEPKFNSETKEITNGEYTMPVKIIAHPTDKYLIIDIFDARPLQNEFFSSP